MTLGPVAALWRLVLIGVVLALSGEAQQGEQEKPSPYICAVDGSCSPYKTVNCGKSGVYDISFALDRSGSMNAGILRNNGVSCPVTLGSQTNCIRKDIMRFVLRQVIKSIFQRLQQPCLEYLELRDTRKLGIRDCKASGRSIPRFHISFWSERNNGEGLTQQTFLGPYGQQRDWNLDFTQHFYKNNAPDMNHWTIVDGEKVMKTSSVEDWFNRRFLAAGTRNAYPNGQGYTYPKYGISAIAGWLGSVYLGDDYKDGAGDDAEFPVFLMTDGETTASLDAEAAEVRKAVRQIRNNVNDRGQTKVQLYGLGLTGNPTLKGKQISLYEKTNFEFQADQDNQYFFKDEASAKRITDSIIGRIESTCEDCWIFPNTIPAYSKCLPLGSAEPPFPGGKKGPPPVERTTRPEDLGFAGEQGDINFVRKSEILDSDSYVKIGDNIFTVKGGTELCWEEPVDGYKQTSHTGRKCDCCPATNPNSNGRLCFCDYRNSVRVQSTETVFGSEVSVSTYSPTSYLAAEIDLLRENDKDSIPITNKKAGDIGDVVGEPDDQKPEEPDLPDVVDPFTPEPEIDPTLLPPVPPAGAPRLMAAVIPASLAALVSWAL